MKFAEIIPGLLEGKKYKLPDEDVYSIGLEDREDIEDPMLIQYGLYKSNKKPVFVSNNPEILKSELGRDDWEEVAD